jgi:hypothetical protein
MSRFANDRGLGSRWARTIGKLKRGTQDIDKAERVAAGPGFVTGPALCFHSTKAAHGQQMSSERGSFGPAGGSLLARAGVTARSCGRALAARAPAARCGQGRCRVPPGHPRRGRTPPNGSGRRHPASDRRRRLPVWKWRPWLHLHKTTLGQVLFDTDILSQRHNVYQEARQRNRSRWSRETRDWEPIGDVWLNCPVVADSSQSRGSRAA